MNSKSPKRRGLVIEGGGFRASYASGVLYQLLKEAPHIHFDVVCANSSSVCTAAYFVTKQLKEIEEIFLEKDALGSPKLLNFWRVPIAWKHSLLNIDFLFDDVFKKQFPLNLKALRESPTEFYTTVLHYETGGRREFSNRDPEIYTAMRASCALPWAYKPEIYIRGERYIDGFYDSVPLRIAKEKGCDEIWIVSTRPNGYRKKPLKLFEKIKNQNCQLLAKRHIYYNQTAKEIESNKDYIVIRPKETLELSRFGNDPEKMQTVFRLGQQDSHEKITNTGSR